MGGCGIMFEHQIVKALLDHVPLYPKGTKVELSDEREAIIFENSGLHNLRPVVRLMSGEMVDLCEKENFALTILPPKDTDMVPWEVSESERKRMMEAPKRYRIAVVDDTKANLQKLQEILENIYEVILLKSGSQMLLYLDKHEWPDLILMDIDMPEMDGIETTRRIRQVTGGKIPILFVTEMCDKKTVLMCRELQAAGYVIRPYNPFYIKGEIQRILTEWAVES
jgi:CheY-like chemotaxis protein